MPRVGGQVVLEYLLLIGISLAVALIIFNNLIGHSDNPKGIRKAWSCMILAIGQDLPGKASKGIQDPGQICKP